MKRNIKIWCLLFILIISLVGCAKDDNKKNDINDKPTSIIDGTKIDDLEISKLGITYEDKLSIINFNIKNISSETLYVNIIEINLYDENDKLILTTYGYIDKKLEKQETYNVVTSVTSSIVNAKKVDYQLK